MEIELKLRLPASAVEALRSDPLLTPQRGARASRKRLDNIYFDTPDHALAAQRIGLRLRKDGRRWLQTVKSGGSAHSGLHQREEIEFPVAGKALEWAPLADSPMAAILMPLAGQLQPQFRTRFSRESRLLRGASGAVIELAIDQGEIIAGQRRAPLFSPICEVELELKSGAVDDLFDLALKLVARHPLVLDNRSKAERGHILARSLLPASPVKAADIQLPPNADAPTVARLAVENCLAQWQANEAGFLMQAPAEAYDSEYLHQLRVGVRRLRVACDPLARLAGWQADALARLKAPLRQLGQQLGAARDWDVFIEDIWPALQGALNDELDDAMTSALNATLNDTLNDTQNSAQGGAAVRQALDEAIHLQRELAHLQARAALVNRETQGLLLQLSRCLVADAAPSAGAVPDADDGQRPTGFDALTRQLEAYHDELHQNQHALKSLSPKRLHALRITAKKLRYLTEFTAGRYGLDAVQPWLKWLKKAQDGLGSRQDRATAAARIARLCKSLDKRHGKVKRRLIEALEASELAGLDLARLPERYWR